MISIIVTLHNKENSIVQVLQSLVAQTAQKWEAVIIDNASDDGSEHQVRSYLIDRRMRYVRLDETVAQWQARQRGLELTAGEWVLFLDGGSILEPNALQALYLAAKKYGTDVAVGNSFSVRNGEKVPQLSIADGKLERLRLKYVSIPLDVVLMSRATAADAERWAEKEVAYTHHPIATLLDAQGQTEAKPSEEGQQQWKRLFAPIEHDGIKVENLNIHIGDAHILKNVSVEIPKNKITCIIGPSGCGKSTLLRTFNRIIDTAEGVKIDGNVWLGDRDIVKVHGADKIELRRHIGLVPQRPCPLPMSIFDNVAYGCKIHGIRKKSVQKAVVEHYLRGIGLWDEVKDRLSSPASRLSGGQQQRLCLARSLAVEPSVLLADESTSALDPISSRKVEKLFVDLKRDYTIVMVTHTLQQAQRIADNIIFMYLGEVIETGPAKEIFNNPQNELTQKYLNGAFS